MPEKEEFIKKVNIDKAVIKSNIALVLIGISLVTYIMPILTGVFDFGVVFESISIICLIIAKIYMAKYNSGKAKICINIAIAAIGWILIYDAIILLSYVESFINVVGSGYAFWIKQFFPISYVVILFLINKDLSKSENPTKYKESTDWFYEEKK